MTTKIPLNIMASICPEYNDRKTEILDIEKTLHDDLNKHYLKACAKVGITSNDIPELPKILIHVGIYRRSLSAIGRAKACASFLRTVWCFCC